jgi:ABC-type nickel/cobalt efflux system permease component RcnA
MGVIVAALALALGLTIYLGNLLVLLLAVGIVALILLACLAVSIGYVITLGLLMRLLSRATTSWSKRYDENRKEDGIK